MKKEGKGWRKQRKNLKILYFPHLAALPDSKWNPCLRLTGRAGLQSGLAVTLATGYFAEIDHERSRQNLKVELEEQNGFSSSGKSTYSGLNSCLRLTGKAGLAADLATCYYAEVDHGNMSTGRHHRNKNRHILLKAHN